MKSQIKTIDALLSEEKKFSAETIKQAPKGVRMSILGFTEVSYRDISRRPISKIIDPTTIQNGN